MDDLHQKKTVLEATLKELGRVAVAFSAGVDSTFLLSVAHRVLGRGVIALTANVSSFPFSEQNEAKNYCKSLGIRHIEIELNQLEIDGFKNNPPNRCYLCKRQIFMEFLRVASDNGISTVIEGSNADDSHDYRPGMKALSELGIHSPLRAAGLTKSDIRTLSKEMGLPTWDKPSMACLATRFEYGELITEAKLSMVDKAEQRLRELGFHQVRVRVHGKVARIEIEPSEFSRIVSSEVADKLNRYLQDLGFLYVTLDLGGYKLGNMNKVLPL